MKDKFIELYNLVFGKELSILPGNLAYSFFLSMIPILTLIVYILATFNLPKASCKAAALYPASKSSVSLYILINSL